MKMLRNLSEKLRVKFISTTLGYSMVRIACLDNAFSGILELKASPVEGQSLQQKDTKRRERKVKNKKIKKSLKTSYFFACPSKYVLKRDGNGQKGNLSCHKCLFSAECSIVMVWGLTSAKPLWQKGTKV